MSELQTAVVFRCRRCGRTFRVAQLQTASPDESGSKLQELLKSISELGLCKSCLTIRAHYAKAGRLDDWERGLL